jgi:hypothetical protein
MFFSWNLTMGVANGEGGSGGVAILNLPREVTLVALSACQVCQKNIVQIGTPNSPLFSRVNCYLLL